MSIPPDDHARLNDLERRVAELEQRQTFPPQPVYQPLQPTMIPIQHGCGCQLGYEFHCISAACPRRPVSYPLSNMRADTGSVR